MTHQELAALEEVVQAGVKIRNRMARMTEIRELFLEMDNPMLGGVWKRASVEVQSNGATLRFADGSNQSRNVDLTLSVEDGRKLVIQLVEFLDAHMAHQQRKLEALKP